MSNLTDWVAEALAVTKNTAETTDWHDAAELEGCQIWLAIASAGSPVWKLEVDLSPVDYADQERDPADHYDTLAVTNATGTEAGQFFDPPSQMDRPFGQYRFIVTETGNVADLTATVAVCRNDAPEI